MRKCICSAFFLLLFVPVIAQITNSTTNEAKSDTTTMQEVVIRAKKPPMQVFPDKIVINVEASVSNTGATAMEVLERSPGITLDRNGTINLKGRQGVLIMIDGKPVQVTGMDLSNLLGSMTAAEIETIEIIDNPSARYDAAGNAGIINIKTKKNRQKGFNGNVSLSFAQGRYTRTTNSLTLNKYSGKVNLFATIGVNYISTFSSVYANRKYYAEDNSTILSMFEQPSYFSATVPIQSLKAGMDYFINKKTTIGVVLNGTGLTKRTNGNNPASWMDPQGNIDSVILTTTRQKEKFKTGAININAKHSFDSQREITFDLDYLRYTIQNDQQFTNSLQEENGYIENISGNIPSTIHIYTGKTDYTQRFSDKLKIETGWKSSHIKTNNQALYFIKHTGDWIPDYNKTNHFKYEENIHALYVNGEYTPGKWKIQGGVRYENTSYKAHQLGNAERKDSSFSRNYNGFFPSVMFSVQADSLNSFTLSAGRRIDRPPFQILNPFVFIINKYTYQTGNPFFKPQYTWNTAFTHSFNNMLTTSLSYSITNDYFSQIFYVNDEGIITYTEGNLDRMENIGLSVTGQWSPTNWWTFSGQVNVNHKKIKGFVWDNLTASLTQMNFNINNQFTLPKGWGIEVSGFMQSREQELQEITEPTGQVIAGISKQLFNNKGTLKLVVRDIFYTQAMEGNTIFEKTTEYFKITRDTRMASIAFSYRFGKSVKPPSRRNTGGADDEMKRVNTTG